MLVTLGVVSPAPDVFGYHDYRAFLRDWYVDRKGSGRVSYRSFARRAGIGSPSYLRLVTSGARNLSREMAARFAGACSLEADASTFFCELVRFNQASSDAERRDAYARLRSFKRYREAHPLEVARDEYHSHWYLPAIREMTLVSGFREDPAWIASRLVPPIRPAEAARALSTLLDLGLLVRDAHGRLSQSEAELVVAAEVGSMHLRNYHRQMMERAAEAIERVPREERNVSSVTIAVDRENFRLIDEAIETFRRQLLELSTTSRRPDHVVQLNVQLFPLTRPPKET